MSPKLIKCSCLLFFVTSIAVLLSLLKESQDVGNEKVVIREVLHDGSRWFSVCESVVNADQHVRVKTFDANAPHNLLSDTTVLLTRELSEELFDFFKTHGKTSFDVYLDDSRQKKPAIIQAFLLWLDTHVSVQESR